MNKKKYHHIQIEFQVDENTGTNVTFSNGDFCDSVLLNVCFCVCLSVCVYVFIYLYLIANGCIFSANLLIYDKL